MKNDNNPFNPNAVVTPPLFAGRSQQVLQILKKLAQVKRGLTANFLLVGERGIGKTALAKLIMHHARAKDPAMENLGFLASYYTVEKGQSFDAVLQASLNQLTDRLPSSAITHITERMGNFFKNGKFSFGAFGVNIGIEQAKGSEKLSATKFHLKDVAISALTNILQTAATKGSGKEQSDGLLIIIDEIHNVEDIEGVAQILRAISTTLNVNENGNVSFLVIGYPDAIQKFLAGDPSAKRSFDTISLSYMPKEEAKQVLIKGFESEKIGYDEQILDSRIDYAGGYPHSIQVLGHNLIEADKDNFVDRDDWDKAVHATALELQTKDFSNLYNFSAKKTQREMLLDLLALVEAPVSKTLLAKEIKDFDGSNIYTKYCLPALKELGAVKENPETGELSLHSPLFRSAILLHIIPNMKKNDDVYARVNRIRDHLKPKSGPE